MISSNHMGEKFHESENVSERKIETSEQCFEKLVKTYNSLGDKINHAATYSGFFKEEELLVFPLSDEYPAARTDIELLLESTDGMLVDAKKALKLRNIFHGEDYEYPEEKEFAALRKQLFEFLNKQEREELALYSEMERQFGENFLGPKEVEEVFTLQNGKKLVEFSLQERHEIQKQLRDFLDAPDVRKFRERVDSQRTQPQKWLLYLEIPRVSDGSPLTIEFLENVVSKDMYDRGQGHLLSYTEKHKDQEFYAMETMPLRWRLGTAGVISETLGADIHMQRRRQKDFAEINGLMHAPGNYKLLGPDKRSATSRPIEIVYRYMLYLRTTGKMLLRGLFDRTIYDNIMVGGGENPKRSGLLIAKDSQEVDQKIGLSFSR